MKKVFVFFIALLGYYSTHAQKITPLNSEAKTSMLDILWKIDPSKVWETDRCADEHIFLKAFAWIESSEGESMRPNTRVLVIRGEYGEKPDGSLYDLGLFFNVIDIKLNSDSQLVTIIHGPLDKLITTELKIP